MFHCHVTQTMYWLSFIISGHLDKLLRSLVLSKLSRYDDEETIAEAKRRFDDHINKRRIIPADLRAAVYRAVISVGDHDTFDTMIRVSFLISCHSRTKQSIRSAIPSVLYSGGKLSGATNRRPL